MAKLTDIERLHYYEGEYLGAADLEAEQEYHRDMRRRHSLGQHTWGLVAGLELAQVPNGGPNGEVDIYLMPGLAIDGFGREIVALNRGQITQEPFAPYFDPNAGAVPRPMYLWVAYDQSLIRASQDACRDANNANAFARVQESYRVAVTSDPASPPNDPLVVDGAAISPSAAPSGPPDPGQIVLPPDSSVPFQEFDADDSALSWYVPVGRVLWDPHKELFLPLPDSSAAQGRRYTGAVAAEILAPGGTLDVVDRFAPSPLPSIPTDPHYAGVNVDIAGSVHIQRTLQVEGTSNLVTKSLLGARIDPNEKTLSPLTIAAADADGKLMQFRSNATTETWHITQNPGSTNPGINFAELSNGNPVDGRLFIQSTITGAAVPSARNVGVGTLTPRNPLSIRSQGTAEELLAFEDSSGATRWHINYNPEAKATGIRGLNFVETGIQSYRLFLQAGGNVGVGTAAPEQNLSVGAGLNIDQANANGGTIGPGLTFGSHSGEGIASARTGGAPKNQAGLDFYTAFAPRLSITQGGDVGIGTNTPQSQLHLTGGQWDLNATEGDFKIGTPAMRLKMGVALGGSGAGDARIYAHGGTSRMMLGLGDALTIFNQRVGINTITPSVALEVVGDVRISGALKVGGPKTGYVADRFVYPASQKLQRGDVVVLNPDPKVNLGAATGRIPLFEVMLTDQAEDTRVCGVVDEPDLPLSEIGDLGLTAGHAKAGLLVTLGAYAYCKVDATKLEVKPGDLLATGDAKGYASPVPRGGAKAGSIIGKALGALPKGKKGLMAILVTHQ